MSMTERVLAYLKEQPASTDEIGEALGLRKRVLAGYNWRGWSFSAAESGGLIEMREGKWHLKEAEPCVEHHWDELIGYKRCRYCQMKYSYWLDVKEAIDRGNVKAEDWACKPHYHREAAC